MDLMKSPDSTQNVYLSLMVSLIRDIHSGTSGSSSKDEETLLRRVENEGLYFLTTILPSLGKALDKSLETGVLFTPLFFAKQKRTNLPRFLFDKFSTIFNSDGTLLDHPDVYSIQEVRQVCFLFYKLEVPFTEPQVSKATETFLQCERDLHDFSFGHCDQRVVKRAQLLLERLFLGYDPKHIVPGHGPGGVNTGEKGNEKWNFKRLYSHCHQYYPYYDYFVSNRREEILDRIKWYRSLERKDESLSRVHFVPKDSRGPRVISVEPLEVQYLQQGQMRSLVKLIENHGLTRGFVNFTDQTINQNLAMESSLTRSHATVDLKEASDRIHVNLVRILFPDNVTSHLLATRSSGTVLPNGDLVPFRKFAPMGSACCFPVLALTIWALSRAYLDVNRIGGSVFVYGDDLIVPTAGITGLCQLLESFALKINWDKTYSAGFFRESCGVDAYRGVDITPIRLSKPWSGKPSDFTAYAHIVSLSERMHRRGFWRCASTAVDAVECLYGKIPYGLAQTGAPCLKVADYETAVSLNRRIGIRSRWSVKFQRLEFKVKAYKPEPEFSDISGWPRLLKGLVSPTRREATEVVFRKVPKLSWRWVAI